MNELKREIKFNNAYVDFQPFFHKLAYAKTGNYHVAEDICQDLFIILFNKIDSIDNIKSWLQGGLRFVLSNYFKKNKKCFVDLEKFYNNIEISFEEKYREIKIIIDKILDSEELFNDSIDRTIFEDITFNHLTYSDCAKNLGLTARQVQYRFGLIKKKMQYLLGGMGLNTFNDVI